jgi:hypothetical protein
MIELLASYGAALAVSIFAAYVVIATRRVNQRIANQELAWPHREVLAALAWEIQEKDGKIPCPVRNTINHLAAKAFDLQYMEKILRSDVPPAGTRLVDHLWTEYPLNPEYGDLVAEALFRMAYVVLLSDRKYAEVLRPHAEEVRPYIEDLLVHGVPVSAKKLREESQREEKYPQLREARQKITTELIDEGIVADLFRADLQPV